MRGGGEEVRGRGEGVWLLVRVRLRVGVPRHAGVGDHIVDVVFVVFVIVAVVVVDVVPAFVRVAVQAVHICVRIVDVGVYDVVVIVLT